MKCTVNRKLPGLSNFDTFELPRLAVLTGLNGAGKTQLLSAINDGLVSIEGIDSKDILLHDQHTFHVGGSINRTGTEHINSANKAWKLFENAAFKGANLRDQARKIFVNAFDQVELEEFAAADFNPLHGVVWDTPAPLIPITEPPFARAISQYVAQIQKIVFDSPSFPKGIVGAEIRSALTSSKQFLHNIDFETFSDAYETIGTDSDLLQIRISEAFCDYKVKQFLSTMREFDRGVFPTTKRALTEKFEERTPPPWLFVNKLLSGFAAEYCETGEFDFQFTTPASASLDLANFQNYNFQAHLISLSDSSEREFHEVSSGEKILLALAISIYQASLGVTFPKLVLLDEIDASLHPSMNRAMFKVIENVFLDNGTNVILSTHSATTIALAPEESVFLVNKGDVKNKVTKISKRDALKTATQEFITLDDGLLILDQILFNDFNIITEGHNATYLKKILPMLGVTDVHIVEGLKHVSGKEQLKSMFDLLASRPQKNVILFVWDCDYTFKGTENNSVCGLSFPRNADNTIATSGIENMFPELLFEGLTISRTDDSTEEVIGTHFNARKKKEFLERFLATGTNSDIEAFTVLIDKIDSIKADRRERS